MLDGKRVSVVVPAHNEEKLIAETIRGIPQFVDRIYVVDDRSSDGTVEAVRALADPRVELIEHERNLGVGGAIVTGYKKARDDRIDVTAVMAADAQMDPGDLEMLAGAVARGDVDYAKANRLFTGQAWEVIPRYRYLGNAVLSLLTKIASGYWHVADSQSGYTAISLEYLAAARPRPDLPALRLPERPARAPERLERAGARLPVAADLRRRRALRDPAAEGRADDLVAAGEGLLLADAREVRDPRLPPARLLLRARHPGDAARPRPRDRRCSCCGSMGNAITPATIVLVALLLISGSQFTLFAMWFDMESNKDLGGRGRRSTDR